MKRVSWMSSNGFAKIRFWWYGIIKVLSNIFATIKLWLVDFLLVWFPSSLHTHKNMSELNNSSVLTWTPEQSVEWCSRKHLSKSIATCIMEEDMDGKCLLSLTEMDIRDLRDIYKHKLRISDIKRFLIAVRALQRDNASDLAELGLDSGFSASTHHCPSITSSAINSGVHQTSGPTLYHHHSMSCESGHHLHHHEYDRVSPPLSVDGRATSIQPEFFKTTISLGMYSM